MPTNKNLEVRVPAYRGRGCRFCQDQAMPPDYKQPDYLTKFLNEEGKILPRQVTGNCANHQQLIALAVKRSREIGLIY